MSDCIPARSIFGRARLQPNGYVVVGDQCRPKRKSIYAHRHVYEECFGAIPDRHEIHHVCGSRDCVNPEHLRPMTKLDHLQEHRPSHCQHGHPLSGDNLFVVKKTGHRRCRTCTRAAQATPEYREKRNARRRRHSALL